MHHILVILFLSTLLASVKFPEYSISQLNDAEFVKSEIQKYQAVRSQLQTEMATAPAIVQLTLREDLRKTDWLLEALHYVENHGLKLDDPGLGKLSFFQKVPVGSTILLPKPEVHMAARISTSRTESRPRAAAGSPGTSEPEASEPSTAPRPLPDGISHGERIDLRDHLVRGQITVFDFFSQYCPPCRQIAPLLEELDEKRRDLTVVKVDINRPDVTGIDWQSPVTRQFELHSIPYFKVFAPDGTLQAEGPPAYALIGLLLDEAGIGAKQ